MKKFLALIIFLTIASISAHAGGDAPKPLGSDVLWYKDTLGTSPFKTKFIGMWFSPDGKTIAVPQGKQLFLVSSETGDVTEKIDVGFYIKGYCAANDRYLLASDTTLYIYDKTTYKLIKQIEFPTFEMDTSSTYFNNTKITWLNQLSPDGKTIVVTYPLQYGVYPKAIGYDQVGTIDVETGTYKKLKMAAMFKGFYSPDGAYFIAYETVSGSKDEPYRVVIYNAELKKRLYDTWDWVNGNASNFSFSADSKILYFKNANTMYAVNLANGFKVEPIIVQGNNIINFASINDSLYFGFYIPINGGVYNGGLVNTINKSILFKYDKSPWGGDVYISPNKEYMLQFGYEWFYKLKIPYDKITKTEEEIAQINNGFTLSPNPFINQATFNIFLKKDQDLSYTIYSLDGKEVKKDYIGKYGAGYANGTLYLADMTPGTYLIVFSGADGKIASEQIKIVK